MFFKFLIFVALIVGFSGCVAQKSQQNQQISNSSGGLPQWYIQAPNNSAIFIYGVGEGDDIKEAKNSALNDMASRLSVSVQSNVNQFKQSSTDTQTGDSFQKKVTSNIDVEVEKIKFSNATIEQSTVVNGKFFVLVKSNKSELVQDYLNGLKLNDSLINKTIKDAMNSSGESKTFELLRVIPMIQKATSQALLLSSLDNSFNSNSYLLEYQDIQRDLDRLKANLTIEVKSNLRHGYFAKIVETLLKQDGYKVVKNGADIKIELNNIINNKREMAWQNVEVATNISTIVNSRTLYNSTIKSNGRSSKSKDDATLIASKIFKSEIESKGIESFIFANKE